MWDKTQIPDLTGKVVLVTGGNAGIGYETVKQLALHGAKVYVAARSVTRAVKAIEKILGENPSIKKENLIWLSLDLSKPSNVVSTAHEFSSKERRLDILGSYTSKLALFRRYGLSKLANILFTYELQQKVELEGVKLTVIALNPGGVATEGGLGVWPAFMRPAIRLLFPGPDKGALTSLFAATALKVRAHREKYIGKFMSAPDNIVPGSERCRDVQLTKSLWDTTEAAVQALGIH